MISWAKQDDLASPSILFKEEIRSLGQSVDLKVSLFPESLSFTAESSELHHIFSHPGTRLLVRRVSELEKSHFIED